MRLMNRVFSVAALCLTALTVGCGTGAEQKQNESQALGTPTYSLFRAGNRYGGATGDPWYDEVQPVLGERCVMCHSCTNGPCQLNMTSYDALERGLSSTNPYVHGLTDSFPTRVSDNLPVSYWRGRGFSSVLPTGDDDPRSSQFFQALELGQQNLPPDTEDAGPFSIGDVRALATANVNYDYVCPATGADYTQLTAKYPMGGMPWALPALEEQNLSTLEGWVLSGATGPSSQARARVQAPEQTAMSQTDPVALVGKWEAFLNANSNEGQLVGRYIYEHSFQANLHLSENPGEYYRIVRSWTAAPAPIQQIVTDTPADPPGGNGRVYYRLQKIDRIIEGKTHVAWPLSLADLAHFQQLFFATPWKVSSLPGYSSINPFVYFQAIPATARARFMIENGRMLFQSFGRGPICMVQTASYVADDYYWVWFLRPESDPTVQYPTLGLEDYSTFFPTKTDNLLNGLPGVPDKQGEPTYRAAFEATLRKMEPAGLSVNDIWDGDGQNPNAWLAYHRHQVSAEWVNGSYRPITGAPRSVWLLSYANFERAYYNATVQYKYWAGLGYQNDSFNFATYQRTEAEDLYISLFPNQSFRTQLRSKYTTFEGMVYNELFTDYSVGRPSQTPFTDEDSLQRAVYDHMGPAVIVQPDRLNHWPSDPGPSVIAPTIGTTLEFEAGLRVITGHNAPYAQFVPNIVHIRVGGQYLYTLLANRAYRPDKISSLESESRDPANDQVYAVAGFAGYEAHLFVDLPWEDASGFLTDLSNVATSNDFQALRARYAIGRNSTRFWPFVDWMHGWLAANMPVEAGTLELRFYDKDVVPF